MKVRICLHSDLGGLLGPGCVCHVGYTSSHRDAMLAQASTLNVNKNSEGIAAFRSNKGPAADEYKAYSP